MNNKSIVFPSLLRDSLFSPRRSQSQSFPRSLSPRPLGITSGPGNPSNSDPSAMSPSYRSSSTKGPLQSQTLLRPHPGPRVRRDPTGYNHRCRPWTRERSLEGESRDSLEPFQTRRGRRSQREGPVPYFRFEGRNQSKGREVGWFKDLEKGPEREGEPETTSVKPKRQGVMGFG